MSPRKRGGAGVVGVAYRRVPGAMRLNRAMTAETSAGMTSTDDSRAAVTTAEKFRLEGRAQALEHLLQVRFGGLSQHERAIIREASGDELNTWLECALAARCAAEVISVTPDELQSAVAHGKRRGEVQGRADALAHLLRRKFDEDGDKFDGAMEDKIDSLCDASLGELTTWTARLLTASTVGEVLAPIPPGTPGAGIHVHREYFRTGGLTEAAIRAEELEASSGWAAVLVQLMTLRFGPLPPCVLDNIYTGTAAPQHGSDREMEAWTERALTAATLDKVFYQSAYERIFAEAFAKGLVKVLTPRLTGRFGELPLAVLDTIHRAGVFDLLTWLDHVEAATSLDDLFAAGVTPERQAS